MINSVEDMKTKILESISQSYPSSVKNKHKNNHQQSGGQMLPHRSHTTVAERKKQGEKRKNSMAHHIEEADFEEELSFSRKRSASVERDFSHVLIFFLSCSFFINFITKIKSIECS